MHRTVSATEARRHLGELMTNVAEKDETVIVERVGKPQIVMLSIAEYERHGGRLTQITLADWLAEVDKVRAHFQTELGNQPLPDIDELINAGRDEWLDDLIASKSRRQEIPE